MMVTQHCFHSSTCLCQRMFVCTSHGSLRVIKLQICSVCSPSDARCSHVSRHVQDLGSGIKLVRLLGVDRQIHSGRRILTRESSDLLDTYPNQYMSALLRRLLITNARRVYEVAGILKCHQTCQQHWNVHVTWPGSHSARFGRHAVYYK